MNDKSIVKKCKDSLNSCKNNPVMKKGLYVAFIPLILLAIADIAGLIPLVPFQGGVFFIVFTGIICIELYMLQNENNQTILRHLRNAILFAAITELAVFQWNSFHLFGGNYPEIALDLSQAVSTNFDSASGNNLDQGEISLEFSDINIPIGTIYFDLETNQSVYNDILIDMSDDTNSAYRTSIATARVIPGNARSQSIVCNFSGNVHSIRFRYNAAEGETVTLHAVTLNRPINIYISFVRLLFLFILYFCPVMLTRSKWARKSITDNRRSVHVCAYILTAAFMLTALFLANLGRYGDPDHSLKKDFQSESGNQITQEIVDAFEAGHVYLDRVPSDELLALENPYDRSQRNGISAPWDHLLFNGKIYSYYGIAPVLLLFLPYHKLTGYYFPTVWAVLLFGCIGIFFMTKLYLYFMYQFFPKMQTAPIICGLALMQMISGAWFCFVNPLFYEIAQMAGFACTMSGFYFLIRANVIGEGKISFWRLTMSAICLGLGVLSRPTLALYCIAAMLFLWMGLRKQIYNGIKKIRPDVVKYLLCALLPYMILGGIQMFYNYARFGSVFEFGIQYSLTINDFLNVEYHSHFALIGLYNYLIAIPDFKPEFPFFDSHPVETFNPQGYYFVATYSAVGILWKALPIFAYLKGKKAYKLTENKNKRMYMLMLIAVCIVIPFAIIFSIWQYGYAARYCVDFAGQILIGALIIAFIIYQKCSDEMKKHLTSLITFSMILCFLLTFGQTYSWIVKSLSTDLQSKALSFARLFEIWR